LYLIKKLFDFILYIYIYWEDKIFFVHGIMKITKNMRDNKILIGMFAIFVVLIHASGLMEKLFGLERKEEESKGIMDVLKIGGK